MSDLGSICSVAYGVDQLKAPLRRQKPHLLCKFSHFLCVYDLCVVKQPQRVGVNKESSLTPRLVFQDGRGY